MLNFTQFVVDMTYHVEGLVFNCYLQKLNLSNFLNTSFDVQLFPFFRPTKGYPLRHVFKFNIYIFLH